MKMKTAFISFLVAAFAGGASCQRLLQDDIPQMWGPTVPIGGGASQFGDDVRSDVEAELVELLETDEQTTVVGSVELGELVCDSLALAVDAAALSFVIQDETLIADQSSYTFTSGDAFEDGIGVHVWTGEVVSPAQAEDELVPRTVSISWGEVCDVETFLLKLTKRNADGTTTMIKTVPCDGVGTFTCLVEVLVEFEEPGDVLIPDEAIVTFGNGNATATTAPVTSSASSSAPDSTGRRLQDETQINVMILYTDEAREILGGITHEQMKTTILESMAWTNQAFINSEVAVRFNPVHIGLLPYDQNTALDGPGTARELRFDDDVALLRDAAEADLVQMIANYNDNFCGWGYYFYNEAYGFSLVKPTCLDNYVHTHEFGHNFGCFHNRDSTSISSDYSHGLRYCDGILPYRTIMSYSCGSPYANYFSNPDVTYLGRPTGSLQEDNARTIEDNMEAISNYRGAVTPPTPPPSTGPPTTAPPTTAPPTTAHPTTVPPTTAPPTTAPPTTAPPTTAPPTTGPPATPPPTTATTYSYVGCYGDNPRDRVLTGEFVKGHSSMTTEVCALLCEGSAYFGTEYGNECFCGPSTDDPKSLGERTCDRRCAGDADQICGDRDAISLYEYATIITIDYASLGCFADDRRNRVLSGASLLNDPTMTTEVCATFCAGSRYFGTEYGVECFCGVASDVPDELGGAFCNFECAGDALQICGGSNAINAYELHVVEPEPVHLGCWGDSGSGRIMQTVQSDASMTNDLCQTLCHGSPFYGTQYGQECWCGDDTTDYQTYGTSTNCDRACPGNVEEICGGTYAMSVWGYQA